MVLVIDNYDSFTYNIVQYLFDLEEDVCVFRNDKISIKEIEKLCPKNIIISPGPKTPSEAGISKEVINYFKGKIPILGICLGHQAVGEVFGALVVRADEIVHGKAREIVHNGKGVFKNIESPFKATRYHSLILEKDSIPDCLEVCARTEDGEVMGIMHKEYKIYGVQFHPESILTLEGKKILANFLNIETNLMEAKNISSKDINIKEVIKKVVSGINLDEEGSFDVMNMIMSGKLTEAQIGSLLTALRLKGETIEEITGFAKSMRHNAIKIKPKAEIVLDTCGTGGDSSSTFNVSTACAFVNAGCGVTVAKHGNRSVSSSSGSADVLKEFGVNLDLNPQQVKDCIDNIGIGFLFAPLWHKAMKYAIGPRREIGLRTVFNILGPLTNPAGATSQVLGLYSSDLTDNIAHVLGNLGINHAFVVSGYDGLDEVSLSTTTRVSEYKDGSLNTFDFDPKTYGFKYCAIDDLKVKNAKESKDIIYDVLSGKPCSARDIVVINSAFGLVAAGKARDIKEGIEIACESIDSKKALGKLKELIDYTNSIV